MGVQWYIEVYRPIWDMENKVETTVSRFRVEGFRAQDLHTSERIIM